MKKHWLFLLGSMIILISCHKESPVPKTLKKGKLTVSIGLKLRVDEVKSGLKSTSQTEDFKVNICNAGGTVIMSFVKASAMPDTIELEPGDFYAEAFTDNNRPAAFDNPYYYGKSDVFMITSNANQSVQVLCSLANTMVSVVYSDALRNSFSDYSTSVSSGTDSLVFTKDETRPGYFQPLPLSIRVNLTYLNPDGTENQRLLSGNIPDPLGGKHYEIHVDASVENGHAMFHLLLDETEIPVEVVEIGGETVTPQEGAIGYGELLITEIMYDPTALSDTDGEWLEIYNATDHAINLQNLILDRDGTSRHTIKDQIELAPGDYFVLARKDTAVEVPNFYSYGTTISLPNSGAILSIYNEDTGHGPGPLIFSVDYGKAGFPSASGASISLDPGILNASSAVSGTSWCTSVSAYSTGDSGTPGSVNDPCL